MWVYSQSTGQIWAPSGCKHGVGYSGHGDGKNNPLKDHVALCGPIPKGKYCIGNPYDSISIGEYALPLMPNGHNALGRKSFTIHKDSQIDPGTASKGSIVIGKKFRQLISVSNVRDFMVIE